MKVAVAIQNKVDELLAVLDKDIQHIEESLSRLNELRSLVIKRDDTALDKLLRSIRAETDGHVGNEQQRQNVRKDLANALDCPIEQMTLSALEAILPEERKAQIIDRKAKLKTLIEQLKKEHLSTALLLSECARFNRLLFRAIFDLGKTGTVMYSPSGQAKSPTDMTLVNLRF